MNANNLEDVLDTIIQERDILEQRNARLVAALEKIAKLNDITTETGRIACKALLNPTPR